MASPDICSPNKGLIVALLEVINRFVKTINDVKDRVTLLEENYAALVEQERYKEEKGLDMLLKTSKDLKSAQERISDLEERFQPKPDESVESEDSKDLKFLPEHSLKVSNSDVVCKKLNKSKKTRTRPSKRAAFSTESSFENFASGEFETSSSTDAFNGFSSQAPTSHDAVVLEGHEIQPQLNSVEFSKAAESENSQINAVIPICSSTSDPEALPNVLPSVLSSLQSLSLQGPQTEPQISPSRLITSANTQNRTASTVFVTCSPKYNPEPTTEFQSLLPKTSSTTSLNESGSYQSPSSHQSHIEPEHPTSVPSTCPLNPIYGTSSESNSYQRPARLTSQLSKIAQQTRPFKNNEATILIVPDPSDPTLWLCSVTDFTNHFTFFSVWSTISNFKLTLKVTDNAPHPPSNFKITADFLTRIIIPFLQTNLPLNLEELEISLPRFPEIFLGKRFYKKVTLCHQSSNSMRLLSHIVYSKQCEKLCLKSEWPYMPLQFLKAIFKQSQLTQFVCESTFHPGKVLDIFLEGAFAQEELYGRFYFDSNYAQEVFALRPELKTQHNETEAMWRLKFGFLECKVVLMGRENRRVIVCDVHIDSKRL